MMKLSLFERGIACFLLSAATIAVASGVKLSDPPEDDPIAIEVDEETMDEDSDEIDADVANAIDEAEEIAKEIDSEDLLGKLVEEVKKAPTEERETKRDALRGALAEVFRKRTEAQRNRIDAMKKKLSEIESQLDRRSSLEEQIVARRLGELLGDQDELSWEHETTIDLSDLKGGGFSDMHFEFPQLLPTETSKKSLGELPRLDFSLHSMQSLERANKEFHFAKKRAGDMAKRLHEQRSLEQAATAMARDESKLERANKSEATAVQEMRQHLEHSKLTGQKSLNNLKEASRGDDDQRAGLLRMQLEAFKSQSKLLQKQLDEISRKR